MRAALYTLLALAVSIGGRPDDPDMLTPEGPNPGGRHLVEGSFRIARGNALGLWVPPDEKLDFEVEVDLGLLGMVTAGTVQMSSGIQPYLSGLPVPGQVPAASSESAAWLRIRARGGELGYELDHTIETRFLPRDWPMVIHTEVQRGSEHRKREVKIGRQAGAWSSTYRGDSHCRDCTRREHYVEASLPWNKDYHCDGCKRGEHREWNQPKLREIPETTMDILGAVYLARNLVLGDATELETHILQKDHLWKIELKRGALETLETPAGRFRCREVQVHPSQPEGEPGGSHRFTGLFGIKGALKIWFHETTGVPVLIEGDVPLGDLIDLHARVSLTKYQGTPEAFRPLK